jgi:hypothetical protein
MICSHWSDTRHNPAASAIAGAAFITGVNALAGTRQMIGFEEHFHNRKSRLRAYSFISHVKRDDGTAGTMVSWL